ncbi:AAA domain-containing protein [Actinomadura litoris]|uniref:AAA domain-containing protein n=1 Tax=Actinomadura litoris TaxID=2678616 RepID=UPI001FA74D4D|nr:AAA domain-containing protein [Actinomadura litoris]
MAARRAHDRPVPLAEALPGAPTFAWVELPGAVPADGIVGREVVLARFGPTLTASHTGPDGSVHEHPVRGRTGGDDDALRAVVTENDHVIAFADDLDEGEPRRRWLRLRVHELAGRFDWGELRVGADEAALGSARSIAGDRQVRGWKDALGWLERQLLFPEPPGGPSPPAATPGDAARRGGPRPRRLVALVAPGQDMAEPVPCRLVGGDIVATLRKQNGEWRLRQVHRETRSAREHERTALIDVRIELFDATVKAGLKRQMREELSRLGSGEGEQTFMAVWRRYHELENRYALRRMRDLGFLEYTRWSYLDDTEDVVRFEIAGGRDGLLTRLREEVGAGHETELECTVQLPEILGGSGRVERDAGLLELELAKGNETGEVVHADVESRTVDMRLVRRGGDADGPVMPPAQGFLHAAVRGDRRRLDRRNRALERLLQGRIPLPQLLPLLQGVPARGKERRPVPAMSPAAEKCFAQGRPNKEQELALRTALNTPDIAVVQGPPGTGKTQLIAALQVRLAEEGRGHAVVSRSMLLTSYQHAAVDNLVERSTVWDLPSMKIDSRNRGSTAHIDNWRTATVRALREEMGGTPDGRRTLAMRDVARRAAEYGTAPVPAEELVRWLDGIAGQVRGLVPDELLGRLEQIATRLRAATRASGLQADHRRESTLRAVRGIRCEPISFGDDGPLMAAAALDHLERLPAADEAHRELLDRAADWDGDGTPPFLDELTAVRDELLDRLTDRADRLFRPAARADVADLLNEIVDELDARRRETAEGVHVALLEYLEALDGDPEAVLATLRLYTTSLAATCQQADSRAVQDVKDGERLFDTVIVDEAARANPLDLLIPLTLAARRVILVGDQNQLPHMLEPDVERELRSDAVSELATLRESLFGRMFTLLHNGDDTPGPRRAVRLREQYRMHPVLGTFVGDNFYPGGGLDSPRPAEQFAHRLDGYDGRPAAWLPVPHAAGGEHGGQSKSRTAEAVAIARELRRHIRARPDLTFGVISFYGAQVRLIWEQLFREGLAERAGPSYRPVEELRRDGDGVERDRLQVGTVDAFQGKQFDVALLSVTRSSPPPPFDPALRDPAHPDHAQYEEWTRRAYGHLMLANRMCVAMSRQERLLVVVGDAAMFTSALAPERVRPLSEFHRLCAPPSASGVLLEPGRRG